MNIKLKLIKSNCDLRPRHDVLLITGDGKSLIENIDEFISRGINHDVLCLGRSIQAYPGKVQHYAEVDADSCKWVIENLEKNHPEKVNGHIITHTLSDGTIPWIDIHWDLVENPWQPDEVLWHGSTALFAVLVGIEMGYEQIILAGVPMDSKGHWYFKDEDYGPRWTGESYQSWFEFARMDAAKKVSSMSGYTKQLLGESFN